MATLPSQNRSESSRGFTLLEVIIAIAIIMVALVGILALMSQNVRTARVSRDQMIAGALVQEAIETVRSVRDSNWLANPDDSAKWLNGLVGTFRVDAKLPCGPPAYGCLLPAAAANLNLASNGFYTYESGAATPFSRTVTVTAAGLVSATVAWQDIGGAVLSVAVQDQLTNWR